MRSIVRRRNAGTWLFVLLVLNTTACLHTKYLVNKSDGSNLGFEIFKKGLPVNWIIYDPPYSAYQVLEDTVNFKEGRQSLRFNITASANKGRLDYTGFTNEFMSETKGGGKYRITFWIMNKDTRFRIYINGVSAKMMGKKPIIIEESNSVPDWKLYEAEIDIDPKMWLRFEVKLFNEGSFWIDDVRIEKLQAT